MKSFNKRQVGYGTYYVHVNPEFKKTDGKEKVTILNSRITVTDTVRKCFDSKSSTTFFFTHRVLLVTPCPLFQKVLINLRSQTICLRFNNNHTFMYNLRHPIVVLCPLILCTITKTESSKCICNGFMILERTDIHKTLWMQFQSRESSTLDSLLVLNRTDR